MTSVRSALEELKIAVLNSARGQARRLRGEIDLLLTRCSATSRPPDSLRIAMVSGFFCKTPPLGYGGVERSFYYQAKDLANRGWDVHLWGDFQDHSTGLYEGLTLYEQFDFYGHDVLSIDPDVIYLAYPDERRLRRFLLDSRAVVVGEFNSPNCPLLVSERQAIRCMNQQFVDLALSRGYHTSQIICVPLYQQPETVYQPEIPREDWLLWVGRPHTCKALEEAFLFSILAGIPLRIACRQPDLMQDGYARALWRLMPDTVSYIGEITPEQKCDLFSRCRAVLYTAQPWWQEAFGLIFLDALASGTPVLALDHHPGSTQSSFFPGPPFGLRGASIEELAQKFEAHGHELRPDAVAARYEEIYGEERVEKLLDAELRRLVEAARTKA